jgi:peptide/nickel transport system substrate-binding protein
MKSQLKAIGVDVRIASPADQPSFFTKISSFDFDMTMDNVFNWGDPIIGVHRTYICDNIRNVMWANTQSYCNPVVDELLNKGGGEPNIEKRKAIYAEAQKIIVDDAPVHFINATPFYTIYKKELGNVMNTIWGPTSPMHEIYWTK